MSSALSWFCGKGRDGCRHALARQSGYAEDRSFLARVRLSYHLGAFLSVMLSHPPALLHFVSGVTLVELLFFCFIPVFRFLLVLSIVRVLSQCLILIAQGGARSRRYGP